MTTDSAAMNEVERVAFEATPYLQVGIPGLPYSAVRIPIVEDLEEQSEWVARAMNAAQLLANAYHDTFASETADPFPERQLEPARANRPSAPAGGPRANGRAQAPTRQASTGAYCPQHPDVEVVVSAPQYQQYDEDENGNQVPAKFYCPGQKNGTGRNHSLWRSQLVWAE